MVPPSHILLYKYYPIFFNLSFKLNQSINEVYTVIVIYTAQYILKHILCVS